MGLKFCTVLEISVVDYFVYSWNTDVAPNCQQGFCHLKSVRGFHSDIRVGERRMREQGSEEVCIMKLNDLYSSRNTLRVSKPKITR